MNRELLLKKVNKRFDKIYASFDEINNKELWCYVSTHQKLSEDFIREFKDKVYWYNISGYQKLSENFIREFKDKVDWRDISKHQNLSDEFKEEFKYYLT